MLLDRTLVGLLCGLWGLWCLCAAEASAQGLASKYLKDKGLENDPDVLYFLDFDDKTATLAWAKGTTGYGWTSLKENVYSGGGALEIQQTKGTHHPYEIHPTIQEVEVAYVRWYRKWEKGYDFTQHKMPGVYAKAPGASGAGVKPDGYDKYSCKLYVDFDRYPRFYTYHPEQQGIYGDGLHMNLVSPKIQVEAERWYCFEMMIKANTPQQHDGELKMWIDGKLVGHYTKMRFRDTATLKINQFTYSAYVGGTWVSEQDQKLWDDQIVVATKYIGPLQLDSPQADGATLDGGVDDAGNGPADVKPAEYATASTDGTTADTQESSQGNSLLGGGCAIVTASDLGASGSSSPRGDWLVLLALGLPLVFTRARPWARSSRTEDPSPRGPA